MTVTDDYALGVGIVMQSLDRVKHRLGHRLFSVALVIGLATIVFGYLYAYIHNPSIQMTSRILFYTGTVLMLLEWSPVIRMQFSNLMKSSPSKRKNNISWVAAPQLYKLAKEMKVKLHPSQPLGIVKCFNNARFTDAGQLLVGDNIYDKLDDQELLALAAHEFAHKQKRQREFQFLFVVLAMAFVYFTSRNTPVEVQFILPLASFLVVLLVTSRNNEYIADRCAAQATSNETVVSTLKKTEPPGRWSREYESHPSIKARIGRLSKK